MTNPKNALPRIILSWLAITIMLSVACASTGPSAPANERDQPNEAAGNGAQPSSDEAAETGSMYPDCPSLPSDLPAPENADQMSEFQGWCSYATQNGYQDMVAFYEDYLSSSGWEKFRRTQDSQGNRSSTHFYYQRDDEKIAIGVLGVDNPEMTIVTIFPGHWIDQACDHSGSGIPTPQDIPIIGDMIGLCTEELPWDDQGWTAYLYEFTTLEDFNVTLDYYRSELAERGWSYVQEFESGSIIQIDFIKPGRVGTVQTSLDNYEQGTLDHLSVTLIPIPEYGDTQVKLVVTAE